jgi:hypothetical protein
MELAMPPKVTAEMAKGFTLYMLKAVLNGRADEVVELVASESWLELKRRSLREHQNIDSSGEVNRLIDKLGGERLPSINLAYVDLS